MNLITKPLIRWAGSKTKLVQHLVAAMPQSYHVYYEPFFGSGCLFFTHQPAKAVVGDFNNDLISFYKRTRLSPSKILAKAARFPRTEEGYYSIRERLKTTADLDQRASMFLYLNRFCFNGIYRTNRLGHFNVPIGARTGGFIRKRVFTSSANLLNACEFRSGDFESTLEGVKTGDFVYLDPPYAYSKHRDRGEYGKGSFKLSDLKRLEGMLKQLDSSGVMFLLSYVECEEIKSLAKGRRVKLLPVKRCIASMASKRTSVNEVLISNY